MENQDDPAKGSNPDQDISAKNSDSNELSVAEKGINNSPSSPDNNIEVETTKENSQSANEKLDKGSGDNQPLVVTEADPKARNTFENSFETNNSTISLLPVIDPAPIVAGPEQETSNQNSSITQSETSIAMETVDSNISNRGIHSILSKSGLEAIANDYSSNSDSEDEGSDSLQIVDTTQLPVDGHREPPVILDSSDSEDSDVQYLSQVKELKGVIEIDDDEDENAGRAKEPIKARGELGIEDLPPIQDLHITVPENECEELGTVHSIVDQLVLVNSIPGLAALDLETVLFLEKGQKVLGEVFDVIGQVNNPMYCVRFNSLKHIQEKGVEVGQTVYIAPKTKYAQFIILPQLLSIRGSDASWENDVEPPERHLDYSDDEEEREARRAMRNKNRTPSIESEPPKKQKLPTSRIAPQRPNTFNRQQYPPTQSSPVQNPSSFSYSNTNTAWHTNYSQQQPMLYRNPYARPPFNPPSPRPEFHYPGQYSAMSQPGPPFRPQFQPQPHLQQYPMEYPGVPMQGYPNEAPPYMPAPPYMSNIMRPPYMPPNSSNQFQMPPSRPPFMPTFTRAPFVGPYSLQPMSDAAASSANESATVPGRSQSMQDNVGPPGQD